MRPLVAEIDLDALRHNYQLACRCAPQSRSVAVIKAPLGNPFSCHAREWNFTFFVAFTDNTKLARRFGACQIWK